MLVLNLQFLFNINLTLSTFYLYCALSSFLVIPILSLLQYSEYDSFLRIYTFMRSFAREFQARARYDLFAAIALEDDYKHLGNEI